MVHAVPATAPAAPLQAPQFAQQLRLIEQLQPLRVDQRQDVEVNLRPIPNRRFVGDVLVSEALNHEFGGVLVARHTAHAVALQQLGRPLPAKIAETLTAPAISVEGGEVSGH